jgi:PAS domain S-box-containing protein
MPGLKFLPDVSRWNLPAGLSFGLLLGYGLLYAPVVFTAHALAAFRPDTMAITQWHVVFLALIVTGLYTLAAVGTRRLANRPYMDLTNRRTLAVLILMVPVTAVTLCGILVVNWAYTGLITWDRVAGALLHGSIGNVGGILLVMPIVVLSGGWFGGWRRMTGNAVAPGPGSGHQTTFTWRSAFLLSAVLVFALSSWFYLIFRFSISDAFLLFCLVSLPLIGLSFRFGIHGAAISLVALGFIAIGKAEPGDWMDLLSELVIIAAAVNCMGVGLLASEGNQQRTTMSRQAALLNSVSFATEQLLGMTDREKNVNKVLRQLAAEANVSRIYVMEKRQDMSSSYYPVVYECSASPTFKEEYYRLINEIRGNHVRLHAAELAQDKALQFRTTDLDEEVQEVLLSLGIHVGIILPIFADGRWWGCLGLDQCSTDQRWSEPEVSAFKATAHVLGALLAHANVEQQFRQFTGSIPAVFWIATPDILHKTYVSPAYEQIWGSPCESIYEKPASWIGAIYHKDYARVRAGIDNRKGEEYDLEYRIVRPNREVRWIRDTAFPVRDASGQVSRVVGIAQDITPQKEAEERLRATGNLLSTLIDNLQVGIVVEDHSRQVMHVNQAFCSMFDVAAPQESLAGMDSRRVLNQEQFGKPMDQVIRKGVACRGEEMVTNDGRVFTRDYIPLSVDGSCHHHLWQYEDITERRRSEEQIRTSLKEVLRKEIHHRVKNNLQIISSLLNLQSMQIRDHQTAQVFRDTQSRVRAIALVHERLYQSADLARIDFCGYVQDVTNHLLRSYQTSPHAVQLKLEVDPVSLNIDTAIPCALIINELVSNALKYAFPDGRQGEIRIRLAQGADEDLNLVISDDGIGFPSNVSFETTDSLGLQLVRSLADQLNGKVQYRHEHGTEFDIKFRAAHERKPEFVAG